MTAGLNTPQTEAIAKADAILKEVGLPQYEFLRLYMIGLEERQVFDHNPEDDAELAGLKLCARQAARSLDPVSDLGDIDYEEEDSSPAAFPRARGG